MVAELLLIECIRPLYYMFDLDMSVTVASISFSSCTDRGPMPLKLASTSLLKLLHAYLCFWPCTPYRMKDRALSLILQFIIVSDYIWRESGNFKRWVYSNNAYFSSMQCWISDNLLSSIYSSAGFGTTLYFAQALMYDCVRASWLL